MKNLDLNAYGVEEMSNLEMTNIEGGNVFKAVANVAVGVAKAIAGVAVMIYDALNHPVMANS